MNLDAVLTLFQKQRENRRRLKKTSAKERIQKLRRLHQAIEQRIEELGEALFADLHKPEAEVMLTEVYPVISEFKHIRLNLENWMRPTPVPTPIAVLGSRG